MAWRCFHCEEVFTDAGTAREHFGPSQLSTPACQVDAVQLRELEETLRRYREEDTDLHRQIARLQCEHRQALRREEDAGYARGLRDARGQFGVAVDLLRETLGPLEVCAATIESEDGGALMESLLGQVRRFVADAGLLVPDRQVNVMALLLRGCKAAAEWLQGWASAEPYLAQLHAAIAAAEPYAPLDGEPEFQSWIQQLRGHDAAGNAGVPAADPRQRGYVHLGASFFLSIAAVLVAFGAGLAWLLPKAWAWLRPLLHAWTA